MLFRQGDVLIARIEALPPQAKPQPSDILFEGELTGHAHRIQVPKSASLWQQDSKLYMTIAEEATIVHDEHGPITLPAGVYSIWQQREYTPQAPRFVRD